MLLGCRVVMSGIDIAVHIQDYAMRYRQTPCSLHRRRVSSALALIRTIRISSM